MSPQQSQQQIKQQSIASTSAPRYVLQIILFISLFVRCRVVVMVGFEKKEKNIKICVVLSLGMFPNTIQERFYLRVWERTPIILTI